MRYSTMKYFLCRLGLLLLLAGIIPAAGACLAQEQGNRGVILPEHYPDRFSGHGCIDWIGDNQVVIDDRLYTFTPDATFSTFETLHAPRSHFRKGLRVGFVKDNRKIQSLWYIDRCR